MNSAKKLQPVARLTNLNERNAARAHGSILCELQKQEKQLNELISYREQYLNAFKSAGESGLSAVQMQDYRIFLQRLNDAILQQQQQIAKGKQDMQLSRQTWQEKRNKSKMINKVVEHRQQLENKQAEKREQRELDDRPNHDPSRL